MVKVILERQSLATDWTIKLANGIEFEYNNLTVGKSDEQFQNRLNQYFHFIGSLNVEDDTLGVGVHYLLQENDGHLRIILRENFDKNFTKVNN